MRDKLSAAWLDSLAVPWGENFGFAVAALAALRAAGVAGTRVPLDSAHARP